MTGLIEEIRADVKLMRARIGFELTTLASEISLGNSDKMDDPANRAEAIEATRKAREGFAERQSVRRSEL